MAKPPLAVVAELRPAAGPDAEPSITLTRGQLRALVLNAVLEALETFDAPRAAQEPQPLLSVSQTAKALGCHRSKVNSMRLEGCPAVKLGSIYRYSLPDVLAWLKARGP